METIHRPLHVGISVGNMEESLEWYKKNLDLELVSDEYVPPLKSINCFIQTWELQLERFQYDEPKPIPEDRLMPNTDLQTIGTKHVAFYTADMKALKERFAANGVDIAHEVTMGADAVMFVRDNSGALLEFIQSPQ